jgi:hypothetical protein
MNTITVHFGVLSPLDIEALLSDAIVLPRRPASSELRQSGFRGRLIDWK